MRVSPARWRASPSVLSPFTGHNHLKYRPNSFLHLTGGLARNYQSLLYRPHWTCDGEDWGGRWPENGTRRKIKLTRKRTKIACKNCKISEGWLPTLLSRDKIVAAPSWIPGRLRWRHPALILLWTPRSEGFLSSKLKSRRNWPRFFRLDVCPMVSLSWLCCDISSMPLRLMCVVKVCTLLLPLISLVTI